MGLENLGPSPAVAWIAWTAVAWTLNGICTYGGEAPHFPPWKIVSAADWHSAEGGVTSLDPAVFEANQIGEKKLIKGTLFGKPEVVLVAGDVGSGHWTMGALKKTGIPRPGETIEDIIHRLGEKTYRSTVRLMILPPGTEPSPMRRSAPCTNWPT